MKQGQDGQTRQKNQESQIAASRTVIFSKATIVNKVNQSGAGYEGQQVNSAVTVMMDAAVTQRCGGSV